MAAPSLNRQFIRNATAVLVSYVFFERGGAGAALRMDNIQVSAESIDLAIALRKNRSRVAHTLSYARLSPDKPSLIDLVLRYDRYRRSARSTSRYYWAIPGQRLTPSSASIYRWLQACLSHAGITPPPQVS